MTQQMQISTLGLSDEELAQCEVKAKTQEYAVYKYFVHSKGERTPSAVHKYLIALKLLSSATPLTSVRRAISNLTKLGLLEKTSKKQMGVYGMLEVS